jgi:hypothetical protein
MLNDRVNLATPRIQSTIQGTGDRALHFFVLL